MEQFILQLGIMSLQACVVICVVLLVREIFARVGIAKKYINILWMLPYLCMVCPWKFESAIGFWRQPRSGVGIRVERAVSEIQVVLEKGTLYNEAEPITAATTEAIVNMAVSADIGKSDLGVMSGPVTYSLAADVWQAILTLAGIIWLVGIIGFLIYSADAHLKLHRKLICCMYVRDNIYIADDIKVPFVMGILKPRIYLPSGMSEINKDYVIAHEKTHIRHLDPLKKTIAFGITCLHWFNPLAWAAFHFYSKDMEMACDEETVQNLGMEHKQDYAETLLSLATGKKMFLGAPLAFDEGNVKSRIKNIVKYKKTWRVLSVVAVIVIVALIVGFMTKEGEYAALSKIQDMVHPSKEARVVIVTLDGETRYFAGEGYVKEISDFLNGLEIKKIPQNSSHNEDSAKDVVLEFGAQRFCFDADYDTIWSDSDVKASLLYQVKNPEEIKAYLEGLFEKKGAVSANLSTEVPTTESSAIDEAVQFTETRELTMEELIELCQAGTETLVEVMQGIPLGEDGAIYTNLDKDMNDYEGVLNQSYFCYLSYEGKDYRLQFSYSKEDNSLWGIYLYHPASDDMTLLYTNEPERYTVNNDIEEFLAREYNIEDYFTCTLPEGTWSGDFKIYYNDVFSGCPILGNYEEMIHGEYTGEAWYAPGCLLIGDNDENNNRMQFENGKAVSARWIGNHRWMEKEFEYIEGCEMQALLYEVYLDLFTAAGADEYMQEHNLSEDELQTVSKYWYVFMGEENSEYIYIVCLNQEYFTKEDVIELARSVEIIYE